MFRRTLEEVSGFTDEAAAQFFKRIVIKDEAVGIPNDNVFPAVLRAIIWPRLAENESFTYRTLSGLPQEEPEGNQLLICVVPLLDEFSPSWENWTRLNNVEDMMKPVGDVMLFIHEEKKSAVVAMKACNHNVQLLHVAASILKPLLPAFFKERPLDEEEKNAERALIKTNSSVFIEAISKLYNRFDESIRQIRNAKAFEKFFVDTTNNRISAAKQKMDSERLSMSRRYQEYENSARSYEAAVIAYEGACAHNDAANINEIVEFLSNRKDISVECRSPYICVVVKTLLSSFDADMYASIKRALIDNLGCYGLNTDDARLLCDALFNEDPQIAVRICANYQIDAYSCGSSRGFDYSNFDCEDYMVNPHIYFHQCLGSYRSYITKALQKGDLITAIDTCVASAKSINMVENSQTVIPFMRDLMRTDKKCIQMPDGSGVTPAQAIEWLKANKETTEV